MKDKLHDPPRWAHRLLRFYCAPHLLEEIEGDLHEEFDYQVKHSGLLRAKIDYIRNVIGFLKPFAIKRKKSQTPFVPMNMIRHYLLVALRNVARHKSFAAINIVGLALGMTCCLFICLWISDEKSIDNFHAKGDHLFNVYQKVTAEPYRRKLQYTYTFRQPRQKYSDRRYRAGSAGSKINLFLRYGLRASLGSS